jgi:hypothetical protein
MVTLRCFHQRAKMLSGSLPNDETPRVALTT